MSKLNNTKNLLMEKVRKDVDMRTDIAVEMFVRGQVWAQVCWGVSGKTRGVYDECTG